MIAKPVPATTTGKAWPLVERWVVNALKRGKADQTPTEIKQALECKAMQLWLAWDGQRAHGCCVTELCETANGKTCNLVAVGGVQFKRWQPLLDTIKGWARENGCVRLEASGRPGWERMAARDGWARIRTVIEVAI
jgi:hypothetical protein